MIIDIEDELERDWKACGLKGTHTDQSQTRTEVSVGTGLMVNRETALVFPIVNDFVHDPQVNNRTKRGG